MAIETRNSSRSSSKTSIFDDVEATRSIDSNISEETSSSSTSEFIKSSGNQTFKNDTLFLNNIDCRSDLFVSGIIEVESTFFVSGESEFGNNVIVQADLEINGDVILISPNGTKYKISVDNSGNLTTVI